MYYVWQQNWQYPDADEIQIPEIWNNFNVKSSEVIEVELPPIYFFVSTFEKLPDALVNRWNYLVFNAKMRDTIKRFSNDPIQYLAAIVSHKATGEEIGDYMIGNPLAQIRAIDQQSSSLEYFEEGHIIGINSLVLNENLVANHSLFRLSEFSSIVIAHEDLVKGIEKSGCNGVQFVPTQEFRA